MRRLRAIGWALFALECAALLGWAAHVEARAPLPVEDGRVAPDGKRFGRSDADRRAIFQDSVRGEMADQASVRRRFTETEVWNRNWDDFFHQAEWSRIVTVAAQRRLTIYQALLIYDEGLRAHWPPPPGVILRADDAPLAATTRPLEQRPILLAAP